MGGILTLLNSGNADKKVGRLRPHRSASGVGAAGLSAAIVAIMPKCPLCWMALASALGLDSWVLQGWMQPIAGVLLVVALGTLLLRARSRRAYGPFWLAVFAAAVMYTLKFGNGPVAGVYAAGAALLLASVWNALPKRASPCCGRLSTVTRTALWVHLTDFRRS